MLMIKAWMIFLSLMPRLICKSLASFQQTNPSFALHHFNRNLSHFGTHLLIHSVVEDSGSTHIIKHNYLNPNMRLGFTLFLMAMVAAFAFAQAPQIPVVISYPEETPQSVIEEAMEAIRKAVGINPLYLVD